MDRQPLVNFVLVGGFDIVGGAVALHQFPSETGYDKGFLGDLMIPDGLHHRNEDWTLFILNRAGNQSKENLSAITKRRTIRFDTWKRNKTMTSIQRSKAYKTLTKSIKPIEFPEFSCFAFHCNDLAQGWKSYGLMKSKVSFQTQNWMIRITDSATTLEHTSLKFHAGHNLTEVSPTFCVLFKQKETALGFKFGSEKEKDEFQKSVFLFEAAYNKHFHREPVLKSDISTQSDAPEHSKKSNLSSSEHSPTPTTPTNVKTTTSSPLQDTDTAPSNQQQSPNLTQKSKTKPNHLIEGAEENIFELTFDDKPDHIQSGSEYVQTLDTKPNTTVPADLAATRNELPFLYCYNVVRTKKDPTVKRGAVVYSMCFCTTFPYFHLLKPILILALDMYYANPDVSTVETIYKCLKNVPVPVLGKKFSHYSINVFREVSQKSVLSDSFPVVINIDSTSIPLRLPKYPKSDSFAGDVSIIQLVKTFNFGVMTIYNAILTEQRILFIADPRTTSCKTLISMVLASVKMVSNHLPSVIRRAFPYAYLGALDFLQVPGYIAGVANPVFKNNLTAWDVLCDLTTGTATLNPRSLLEFVDTPDYAGSNVPRSNVTGSFPWLALDQDFYYDVEDAIEQHCSDSVIESMFSVYTKDICQMASNTKIYASADEEDDLSANIPRISLLKKSISWFHYKDQLAKLDKKYPDACRIDYLVHEIIAYGKKLPGGNAQLAKHLDKIIEFQQASEESSNQLLSFFPENEGGLFVLGSLLLVEQPSIWKRVVTIFDCFFNSFSGRIKMQLMNPFLRCVYESRTTQLAKLNSPPQAPVRQPL